MCGDGFYSSVYSKVELIRAPRIGTDLGDSSMQVRANSLWPVSLVVRESFVEQNGVFGPLDFLNYISTTFLWNIQTIYKFYRAKGILYIPVSRFPRSIYN